MMERKGLKRNATVLLFLLLAPGVAVADDSRSRPPEVRLEWPLAGGSGQVVRPFGRTVDPETGAMSIHDAVDIAALPGTPVLCPLQGVVRAAGFDPVGPAGAFVVIEHRGTALWTVYRHLREVRVDEGDLLETGDAIGTVGNTGAVSDFALGLQVFVDDVIADPLRFLLDAMPPAVREWHESQAGDE